MRILTGDECGLIKEVIPELCRPPPDSHGVTPPKIQPVTSVSSITATPSATQVQADAASMMIKGKNNLNAAIQRLEPDPEAQNRSRGVISLVFVPSIYLDIATGEGDDDDLDRSFGFAALRMNGTVETWNATRSGIRKEASVSPANYRLSGSVSNVFEQNQSHKESGENNTTSSIINGGANGSGDNQTQSGSSKGWYCQPPILPIGMASRKFSSGDDESNVSNDKNAILAACDSIGNVSLVHANDFQKGVVARYEAFDSSGPEKNILTYTKGRYQNTSIATALAMDGQGERLAVGGRERGTKVIDVETGKLLWKAKNLPPNPQTLLQHPMWTTSIEFINSPPSSNTNPSLSDLLATGTAYKQVQIYDIRSSSSSFSKTSTDASPSATRRPVLYTPEHMLTHRVTSLCQLPDGNRLAVGDAVGDCHLLDMRKMNSGKQYGVKPSRSSKEEIGLGRLVGPGGSIRQLALHPTLPVLACVGLDRKLWTWDVNRRRMVDCVYLKQRLNCVLFCGDETWNSEDEDDAEMDVDGNSGEWTQKRERDLEEDEVKDYIDSDDDAENVDSDDDEIQQRNSEEDTDSNSNDDDKIDDGNNDDSSEKNSSDSNSEDESTESDSESESKDEPWPPKKLVNPKKRQRK